MKLIIRGRPATKKNSSRVVRNGKFTRVLPSKAYEEYEKVALLQLRRHRMSPIDEPMMVCCHYYLPDRRWWPDLVGLLQATSDILQKGGIIADDKFIVSYGDSRICGLSKSNPRVEIEIEKTGGEALWKAHREKGDALFGDK